MTQTRPCATLLRLCIPVACAAIARAGIAPENVAVVVNGDSWASLTVANEYARLRHIPPSNFIVLGGISAIEETDVERFRTEILGPVFDTLKARGLADQIDCIAYSCDLPYAADVSRDMAGKPFPQIITGVASVNGLTYLHEWVRAKDTDYLRLDINRYARRTLPLVDARPMTAEEQAQYRRGMKLYDEKNHQEAAAVIGALAPATRGDPGMLYNLACCQALAGQRGAAINSLRAAYNQGWRNHGQMMSDPDIASIRDGSDFQELVQLMKTSPIEVQPTRGFRARYAWDAAGEPGQAGPRYMLSTVLGVTSGRGNSVNEVLECLRRSAAADGDAPRGTIYFVKNGDVRSATRDWAFPSAMTQLQAAGVTCVTEDGLLPKDRKDVAGAVIGTAEFDWSGSKSTVLPGAICEHLTSFGGIIRERNGQTPCTEFIRAGAAGTSGTVIEPYALQEKFPTAFMHLHYARGSTLAEAFYQSLSGPYQLLIIGDPLCRPWGHSVRISTPGLAAGAVLEGSKEIRPAAAGARPAVASYELYAAGRFVASAAPNSPLVLDTTPLPDGHHELSIVAVQADPLETRSRHAVPVIVKNGGREVQLAKPAPARANFGAKLALELACEGSASIELMHLGRPVGRCDSAGGTVELDTARLGTGNVELIPVAHAASGKAQERVLGAPIRLQVLAPAAMGPKPPPAGSKLAKGLAISIAGDPPLPVADTFDGNWLANLGIKAGQKFELTGYFEAPKADLYQVQIQTNTGAKVDIDDVQVLEAPDGKWRFAPASLRPGTHRLRVTGVAAERSALDLRLGAAGAYKPSAERFQHAAR